MNNGRPMSLSGLTMVEGVEGDLLEINIIEGMNDIWTPSSLARTLVLVDAAGQMREA
jgi:hypothetical protein